MRDWQNFFTAEDFKIMIDSEFWHAQITCKESAEIANALLKKALDEAPKVYEYGHQSVWQGHLYKAFNERDYPTHTARLVCVEEIK